MCFAVFTVARVDSESRMVYPVQAVGISRCCCIHRGRELKFRGWLSDKWKNSERRSSSLSSFSVPFCLLLGQSSEEDYRKSWRTLQSWWDCPCLLVRPILPAWNCYLNVPTSRAGVGRTMPTPASRPCFFRESDSDGLGQFKLSNQRFWISHLHFGSPLPFSTSHRSQATRRPYLATKLTNAAQICKRVPRLTAYI
jgi:hypothetical protein